MGLLAGALGVLMLGAVAFLGLSKGRLESAKPTHGDSPPTVSAPTAPATAPVQATLARTAATTALAPPVTAAAQPDPGLMTPVLVVDTQSAQPPAPPPSAQTAKPGSAPVQTPGMTADELFAGRVGAADAEAAHSTVIANPGATVPEGAIIAAVLETAVNTDLSGYCRALVSRDVRSFDGAAVLIPRGSRLIGQYRSGLSAGQTRVYIEWSRLLRPDGVSIELASPAADDRGESGVDGKVDAHTAGRYGPTVLLSVLSGALSALTNRSSVTISSTQGAQEAGAIALQDGMKLSPTIRAPQGAPIQVFVTRDLVFDGPAAHAP
jgi:type IV secretion system protein VirB10